MFTQLLPDWFWMKKESDVRYAAVITETTVSITEIPTDHPVHPYLGSRVTVRCVHDIHVEFVDTSDMSIGKSFVNTSHKSFVDGFPNGFLSRESSMITDDLS